MREAMRLGSYISLGGVVTFKNARHSVEVASEIPLDRLLLETDAPYMAPVPFRGKRCDSSMIVYAAEKIAALRGIGVQELLDITADNAKTFTALHNEGLTQVSSLLYINICRIRPRRCFPLPWLASLPKREWKCRGSVSVARPRYSGNSPGLVP